MVTPNVRLRSTDQGLKLLITTSDPWFAEANQRKIDVNVAISSVILSF